MSGVLALAFVLAGVAIPGATYDGTVARGGSISFTVSDDGARLVSYSIGDVPGDTCTLDAGGDAGDWDGTDITGGAFDYRLGDAVLLRGAFTGSRTASGTLRISNGANPGAKTPCDTGVRSWTASTRAGPPGDGPPEPIDPPLPGAGGAPGGGGAVAGRRPTGVLLRRGHTRLTGRVSSPSAACRAERRVKLVRGARTLATTTSKADGSYAFLRRRTVRGHRVRVTVAARAGCLAASSRTIRG